MKKYLLAALLLLAGCVVTTESPHELAIDLHQQYGGRTANQFFYSYGRPASEVSLPGGYKSYRWTSLKEPFDSDEVPPQYYYCEIEIYTDNQDIIQDFAILVDSVGKWSASRCSEIFTAPPCDCRRYP